MYDLPALKFPFTLSIKEYKKPLFEGISLERKASSIYQALCLPVSVDELLQANQLGVGISLKDCCRFLFLFVSISINVCYLINSLELDIL
jgi:hypothetical protein